MPWEDILKVLRKNTTDQELLALPKPQETLKYMLRVHLRVSGYSLQKHLKQVRIRPCVILHLLNYLIDQDHEVFRGKGTVAVLKQRMRAAVEREYPEQEGDKPEEQRDGTIPQSIAKVFEEIEEERSSAKPPGRPLLPEKNSTPGDGPKRTENIGEELRPSAWTMDRAVQTSVDPEELRQGAVGDLYINTGKKFVDQWNTSFTSSALPFVIPLNVSGPDYNPEAKVRRLADAGWVPPPKFCQAFSRRVEAQCCTDHSALPIIRSVAWTYTAEHTMSPITSFAGKRD